MKLEIQGVPPSLNKVLRMHWTAKTRLNNAWYYLVREKMPEHYLKPFVKMRCSVILTHSRAYDHDNAYGAVKPVIDALKRWKLIFDDTPEYLDLEVVQVKSTRKESRTVIELEPA